MHVSLFSRAYSYMDCAECTHTHGRCFSLRDLVQRLLLFELLLLLGCVDACARFL